MFIYKLSGCGFKSRCIPTYLSNALCSAFCKHTFQSFALCYFLIRALVFYTASSLIWTNLDQPSKQITTIFLFNSMEKFLILSPKKLIFGVHLNELITWSEEKVFIRTLQKENSISRKNVFPKEKFILLSPKS